ncbi:MAG: hypothetical protein ACRDHZ_26280, partial [Ktedonobacteraceae bacterium]
PDELPVLCLLQHSGRSDPTDYLQNEARAHYLVGWPGRKLYQWHIRPDAAPMYTSPTNMPDIQPWGSFEMDQQTNDWYLRNLSKQAMYYQLPGESSQQWYLWQPGSDILLLPNMYLQFGPAPWHFRASIRFMHVGK